MPATSFAFSYASSLRTLFRAVGLGPGAARVIVDDDAVDVRMGWGFRTRIARANIRAAGPNGARVRGWGVHGWAGRWLVNGSSQGLVELTIDPPVPARAVGWPVRLRRLRLSLVDPDGFLTALGPPSERA